MDKARTQKIFGIVFLLVVTLGVISPWSSFFPRAKLTRFLWNLQLSNSYSPFTKYENYNADSYFERVATYRIVDKKGQIIKSQLESELFLKTSGTLMAKVPFRIMSIVLVNKSSLIHYAEDLMHYIGCERPDLYFDFAQIQEVDSIVLSVTSKAQPQEVVVKCATK